MSELSTLPIIASSISLLSGLAVALIGILYRNLLKDQDRISSKVDQLLIDNATLREKLLKIDSVESRVIQESRDMSIRIGLIENNMGKNVLRLDRHGEDILKLEKRLNYVQGLISNGD